jgi:Fic-DOC domain mobile mystery protein B
MGIGLDASEFGQTPIDPDQLYGLKIPMLHTHAQINAYEQANINEALRWLMRKRTLPTLLTTEFICLLHRRMFGHVWKWAGTFRKVETNIGVPWYTIPTELNVLLADVQYWILHQTFSPVEIAIRFKFRLVSIHCFPNGNGRHARLMADLLMQYRFGLQRFSWGAHTNGDVRKLYLLAIQQAAEGNFVPLIDFAQH